MDISVVGSIALDDLKTPFCERNKIVGGSSIYFSIAASILAKVGIIGVVGKDFPSSSIKKLNKRGYKIPRYMIISNFTSYLINKDDFTKVYAKIDIIDIFSLYVNLKLN